MCIDGLELNHIWIIMTTALKTLVSKKKHRFIKDGYNLDLTYISGKYLETA